MHSVAYESLDFRPVDARITGKRLAAPNIRASGLCSIVLAERDPNSGLELDVFQVAHALRDRSDIREIDRAALRDTLQL
jgi:hypothetical protein